MGVSDVRKRLAARCDAAAAGSPTLIARQGKPPVVLASLADWHARSDASQGSEDPPDAAVSGHTRFPAGVALIAVDEWAQSCLEQLTESGILMRYAPPGQLVAFRRPG
jgi:antitoxin (DNA-binding transcriptional repressor) of toxin-antitoxin stability system